jgi:hypothetical protein
MVAGSIMLPIVLRMHTVYRYALPAQKGRGKCASSGEISVFYLYAVPLEHSFLGLLSAPGCPRATSPQKASCGGSAAQ